MRRFAQLFRDLDESNRTNDKVDALANYFREAPPEDAAWALWFLTGNRFKAPVKTARLREWCAELSGFPLWMIEECYDMVGDLAETIALILPEADAGGEIPRLNRVVADCIAPLREWDEDRQFGVLKETWSLLGPTERFVYNKLITGAFRVGVARTLVVRALARVAEVDPAVMAHRIMGSWEPSGEDFVKLLEDADAFDDPLRPYPFFLAYAIEGEASALGPVADWQFEWKWDGIRAQLIKRQGQVVLWSRGEEMLTDRFPEIVTPAAFLPDGTVLDGEVLAYAEGSPLPFSALQQRIGRKRLTRKILQEVPAVFMAYDCLESGGEDRRPWPLDRRREELEAVLQRLDAGGPLLTSEIVAPSDWEEAEALRAGSRKRGVEGFMVKRREGPYRVGRVKGDWWKWKVDPYTIDAVMIYAQQGHGRRAGLFTDYTFALWDGEELVTVAKAYSGLDDAEIREVDRFVRQNTLERFGPVRVVRPELVFELAFEGVQHSKRHKSGVAVRFPRMARWRKEKPPREADRLETLRALAGGSE